MDRFIHIIGACENNLRQVEVQIPIGKLTVITGDSGSGKSSLAFDVLYSEMKRRYLEVLIGEADRLPQPDVKQVEPGLAAIALGQINLNRNPYSTIATFTGLKRILRDIFELAGTLHCVRCGRVVPVRSREHVIEELLALEDGTKLVIKASVSRSEWYGGQQNWLKECIRKGYLRCEIDGQHIYLEDLMDKVLKPSSMLSIIIDRIIKRPEAADRISDSLRQAINFSNGMVEIDIIPGSSALVAASPKTVIQFSETPRCAKCHSQKPFSSNSHSTRADGNSLQYPGFVRKIAEISLDEILSASIADLKALFTLWIDEWQAAEWPELKAACTAAGALNSQLNRFLDLRLGYIRLDSSLRDLSSGERQKVYLAAVMSRSLSGLLYVLDEPLASLNYEERKVVMEQIASLKACGNTVVVVEHDIDLLKDYADYVIELGPGAGDCGGQIVYQGSMDGYWSNRADLEKVGFQKDISFYRKKLFISRDQPVGSPKNFLTIAIKPWGNLKIKQIKIPLGTVTGISGPSGSGKTILAKAIFEQMRNQLHQPQRQPRAKRAEILDNGHEIPALANVWFMDENLPAGSYSSVVSTYIGVYSQIASLFARTRQARSRGITPGYLSLAKKGGRCEKCKGTGELVLEPEFLPPVRFECNICGGQRFASDVLTLEYRGMNLSEVLDMTVDRAIIFFKNITPIRRPLEALARTGLGYLRLGQNVSSLSGGERQRLKLASVLSKKRSGKKGLFILDNVTRGLSLNDIYKLLNLLIELEGQGHSVIVVENHKLLLANCTWLIELGPGSGPEGGTIVYEGPRR